MFAISIIYITECSGILSCKQVVFVWRLIMNMLVIFEANNNEFIYEWGWYVYEYIGFLIKCEKSHVSTYEWARLNVCLYVMFLREVNTSDF